MYSKKVIHVFLIAMLLICIVLSGCGAPETQKSPSASNSAVQSAESSQALSSQPAASTSPQPAKEKVITFVVNTDLNTLDPHLDTSTTGGIMKSMPVFDRLIDTNEKMEYVPALAESWSCSDDGLVWTFKLRKNVKFHDGTPFNADAVKKTWERAVNPQYKLAAAEYWNQVVDAKVVNDYEIQLICKEPCGAMLARLSDVNQGCIVLPTVGEKMDKPVGTGPFMWDEYVPGDHLTLKVNKDYWGQVPGIDKITMKVVPEASTRALMLQNGEADMSTVIGPQDFASLKANKNITVGINKPIGWLKMDINCQIKPFSDVRVRQAMNYAVDKANIVKNILYETCSVATSPVGAGAGEYINCGEYKYDPAKAKQLLSEAGYPNGFKMEILCPNGRYENDVQVVQAIQANLKEVGIDAKVTVMEWAAYLTEIDKPLKDTKVQACLLSWGGQDGDTDLRPVLHSTQWPNGCNNSFYKNTEVDKLLDDGVKETDQQKRNAIYQQVQKTVWAEAPWLFLYDSPRITGWQNNVKGIILHPTGTVEFRKITVE